MTSNGSETVPELNGAQSEIATEFFANDTGLFILDSVPGAGKSFVRSDLAAKYLLSQWERGNRTPTQNLAVLTFTVDEAADISGDIIDRMRALVQAERTTAATSISDSDLATLSRRVRNAPYIGTIDSIIRQIHTEIADDIGYPRAPSVGNAAEIHRLHRDSFSAIQSASETKAALTRLQDAYPDNTYDKDIAELLRDTLQHYRSQCCSMADLETQLTTTIDEIYTEGRTEAITDIQQALIRTVPSIEDPVDATIDTPKPQALVDADQKLYDTWHARVADFMTVFEAYVDAYERRSRKRGVLSHLDCAADVADYFADMCPAEIDPERDELTRKERVYLTHATRIQTWFLDEAQDLSQVQHAALKPFVTESDRVFAAGDLRQSIYGWRAAHPQLFATAITEGTYLGIDWSPHVVKRATNTYRARPTLARSLNNITRPLIRDPLKGNLGDLQLNAPELESMRSASEADDDPAVHVATFRPKGFPGTSSYISPDQGQGEAGILAQYLAAAITQGDIETQDSPVTVLFRRRNHMDTYAEIFASHGLSVTNASTPLLETEVVTILIDVSRWLTDPMNPQTTQTLLNQCDPISDTIELPGSTAGWDLQLLIDAADPSTQTHTFLTALQDLRRELTVHQQYRPTDLFETIAELLSLRADSHNIASDMDPSQRVSTVDQFISWVADIAEDDPTTIEDLTALLTPLQEEPAHGPRQVAATANADVVFKTIHQMKGQEAETIALADLGIDLSFPGAHRQRLITGADTAGLAPPESITDTEARLSGYENGLYGDPDSSSTTDETPQNMGLRWATEQWDHSNGHRLPSLIGHSHLQTMVQERRAESWRVLYVALTRARDDLILPLPDQQVHARPQDSWTAALLELLPEIQRDANTVTLSTPTGQVSIGVNDVTPTFTQSPTSTHDQPRPLATTTPITPAQLPPLVPRVIRPSTIADLLTAPDEALIKHLLQDGSSIVTHEAADIVPFNTNTISPENLGDAVHELLETFIHHARAWNPAQDTLPVRTTTRNILQEHVSVQADDFSSVERFLIQNVVEPFLRSDTWDRIMRATHVSTEYPLTTQKTISDPVVNSLAYEFDAAADIVFKRQDGRYEVVDLKLTLSNLPSELQARYTMQIKLYQSLLSDQTGNPVDATIQLVGVNQQAIRYTSGSAQLSSTLETVRDTFSEQM